MIQRARTDFLVHCEHLGAHLLRGDTSPSAAKSKSRQTFKEIERATVTGALTEDERGLIDRYIEQLEVKINWVAQENALQRALYRMPEFVRNWVLVALFISVTIAVALAFKK